MLRNTPIEHAHWMVGFLCCLTAVAGCGASTPSAEAPTEPAATVDSNEASESPALAPQAQAVEEGAALPMDEGLGSREESSGGAELALQHDEAGRVAASPSSGTEGDAASMPEAEAEAAPVPRAGRGPARRAPSASVVAPATSVPRAKPMGTKKRLEARESSIGIARSASAVKAGEWDDNANFREFLRYLEQQSTRVDFDRIPLMSRRFIVVRDVDGKPVPNCPLSVSDDFGDRAELVTTSSGRALLFPEAVGLRGRSATVEAECLGHSVKANVSLKGIDGLVELNMPASRSLPRWRTVDIAFVIDTTGSMSEEIDALRSTISAVASTLRGVNAQPRLALVEYKDVGDAYVTKLSPMTTDVEAFIRRVESLEAEGGGDMPEHVNAALSVAARQVDWSQSSVARLAFLIGDAPPHLDYQQDTSYAKSMQIASQRGIQIFTIAASGMDDVGQTVWRQVAQFTGGTNMFVLRGGAGPQSTGGGDPTSSCGGVHENYSSGNLDQLISSKVDSSLKALDADPLRIAGLNQDEKAKPCSQRIDVAR